LYKNTVKRRGSMKKLAVGVAISVAVVVGCPSFSPAYVKPDVSRIDTYLMESIRDNDPFVLYKAACLKKDIKDILAELDTAILQNPEEKDVSFLKEIRTIMRDDLYSLENILVFVAEDVDTIGEHVRMVELILDKIRRP